ncbi:MAG: DUF6153 family protein [Marmoricola sp.]
MSARQSFAGPARTALRLVGLLVVLTGLFGMHGLSNHGVAGMENMPQVTAPASVGAVGSTLDRVSGGPTGQAGPLSDPVPGAATLTSGPGQQGMDMNMAGLCVATLAVGLFALLLLLRLERLPRAPWFLQRRAFALKPVGRDPDPPSLSVLSIQRC